MYKKRRIGMSAFEWELQRNALIIVEIGKRLSFRDFLALLSITRTIRTNVFPYAFKVMQWWMKMTDENAQKSPQLL